MKRAIYTLLGALVLGVLCYGIATAAEEKKWLMVLLLYQENEVADFKLIEMPSAGDCKKRMDEIIARARAQNVEIWGECVEITRVPLSKLHKERDS